MRRTSSVRRTVAKTIPLLLAATSLQGCGPLSVLFGRSAPIEVPAYELRSGSWLPGQTRAGFSQIDITPPPGIPTGGHGPAGAMARGYWTRLYARAFLFTDPTGRIAVLVSCDLFAIPRGLTESVARRVALEAERRHMFVPPEAIVIAATHTHQSPGNFMSSTVYNQYGSKYSGFDPLLFAFLVDRIGTAVVDAMADAMRSGPAAVAVHEGTLGDSLVLNRSPETFMTNWNAARLMDQLNPPRRACQPDVELGEAREKGWAAPGCPRLRAIDRHLTVVEVTRGNQRAAVMVFAAFHPTVLEHTTPLFSSDVAGIAVSRLEHEWTVDAKARVVVAFFNGAEGDVVARRAERDVRDVVRVASIFERDIKKAIATGATAAPLPTIVARRGVMSPGTSYASAPESLAALAAKPRFGAAALGGGEGDRTRLYQLGWSEGEHEVPGEAQGGKLYALDSQLLPISLTNAFAPPAHFPTSLPLSYVSLGPVRLLAVPLEMSTAAGHQLREAVAGPGRVEIIGLANEYSSYVATPDEYETQDYMAASTIWGPRELTAVIGAARCVSGQTNARYCEALYRPDSSRVEAQRFDPGGPPLERRGYKLFGPDAVGEPLAAPDDQLDAVLRNAQGAPARSLPTFAWNETVGPDSGDYVANGRRLLRIVEHRGTEWIPRMSAGGVPDDDRGTGFVTLLRAAPGHGRPADQRQWSAIWISPILESVAGGREYRFEVTASSPSGATTTLRSCPFMVDLTPARRQPPVPIDHGSNCTT